MRLALRYSIAIVAGCVTLGWLSNVPPLAAFEMAALPFAGPAAGEVVAEQQRAGTGFRIHQQAIARVSQPDSVGKYAAALEHEINKPRTAIGNHAQITMTEPERMGLGLSLIRWIIESRGGRLTIGGDRNGAAIPVPLTIARRNSEARA